MINQTLYPWAAATAQELVSAAQLRLCCQSRWVAGWLAHAHEIQSTETEITVPHTHTMGARYYYKGTIAP